MKPKKIDRGEGKAQAPLVVFAPTPGDGTAHIVGALSDGVGALTLPRAAAHAVPARAPCSRCKTRSGRVQPWDGDAARLFEVAAHVEGPVFLCSSCARTLEAMALRAAGERSRAGSCAPALRETVEAECGTRDPEDLLTVARSLRVFHPGTRVEAVVMIVYGQMGVEIEQGTRGTIVRMGDPVSGMSPVHWDYHAGTFPTMNSAIDEMAGQR